MAEGKMYQWIKCDKAMPEKYRKVMVTIIWSDGAVSFRSTFLREDGWDMGSSEKYIITHWMKVKTL